MIIRTPEAHGFTGSHPAVAGLKREDLRAGRSGYAVQTKRLYLSPLCLDDVDDVKAIFGHQSVARMTHAIAHPFSDADARAYVEKARHNSSPRLPVFGIRDADETLIGVVGLERTTCGHRVLHAAHFADNAASARMLARAGFLYTGRRTAETSLARQGMHEALHMIRLL